MGNYEEGSLNIVTLLLSGRATPYLHNGVRQMLYETTKIAFHLQKHFYFILFRSKVVYVGDEDHYAVPQFGILCRSRVGLLIWFVLLLYPVLISDECVIFFSFLFGETKTKRKCDRASKFIIFSLFQYILGMVKVRLCEFRAVNLDRDLKRPACQFGLVDTIFCNRISIAI